MKIKFIQKFLDILNRKEKFISLKKQYKSELYELYLSINSKEKHAMPNLADFSGTVIAKTANSTFKYLFPNAEILALNEVNLNKADYYFINGTHPNDNNISIAEKAFFYNKPLYIFEIGFLYGADTFVNNKCDPKFNKECLSFTFDSVVPYYDARYQSNLEKMLNDKNLVVTDEEKQRARRCIDKIVETHLTKYNHQPIYEPKIGREGVKKVLVVDQSYGDMSISKGLANDDTFKKMLKTAIKENPDADIIVKTHPDTMTGRRGGYYTGLKPHDNIYTQTEPINPISLIKYVDKVYVCTTQFGFEALMCGKEVHTFGMPFYANWGLTTDLLKCERRNNTRSLEELFYISYILYNKYVNPETKQQCEIEEAMDYLLKLREEYWNFKNAKS